MVLYSYCLYRRALALSRSSEAALAMALFERTLELKPDHTRALDATAMLADVDAQRRRAGRQRRSETEREVE